MTVWTFDKEFREIYANYPSRPTWSYPTDHTVYDEDKSVRWNRDKVLEEQKRWKAFTIVQEKESLLILANWLNKQSENKYYRLGYLQCKTEERTIRSFV